MDYKKILIYAIAFLVIQFLISSHIFVTFNEMASYAASKDNLTQVMEQLNRIEHKIDKIILGY